MSYLKKACDCALPLDAVLGFTKSSVVACTMCGKPFGEPALRDRFEVKTEPDGKFGLYLDGECIGTSKAHCDCDHAREVILKSVEKNNG